MVGSALTVCPDDTCIAPWVVLVANDSLETMAGRSRPVSIGIIIKSLLDGLTSDEEETRNIAPPGESCCKTPVQDLI
jgi:hypothetical protein